MSNPTPLQKINEKLPAVNEGTIVRQAELTEEDLQLIAVCFIWFNRVIAQGVAQHIAEKFLMRPIQLTTHDVEVVCTALGAMCRELLKAPGPIPREQRHAVKIRAELIIQKLQRGVKG